MRNQRTVVWGTVLKRVLPVFFLLAFLVLGPATLRSQEVEPSEASPKASVARKAMLIRLTLPITEQTNRRVKRFVTQTLKEARAEGVRPVIVLELYVPPTRKDKGRGSVFGTSIELARFLSGEALAGATTVAYIPQSIEGHAVLIASACDRIMLGPDATIGAAGIDEKQIDSFLLAGYEEIASRRKTIPPEIALAMLDPSRKLLEVTTEAGSEFVTPEGLEELKEKRSVSNPRELVAAGEPAVFDAEQGNRLGFVSKIVPDVRGVAREMKLPPESLKETFLQPESLRAARVDLRGPLDANKIDQARRAIAQAVDRDGANFICLWIDSPGGSPEESFTLANYLIQELPSDQIHVVAYVPSEARAEAAIVALAADEVVVGPNAIFGGSGDYAASPTEIDQMRDTIKTFARDKNRTWSLPAAIIDPRLTVFRCTRLGVDEYFCDEERESQPDAEEWKRGGAITKQDSQFKAIGQEAVDFRLADKMVDSFDALKTEYGLEDDPALVEPDWSDELIAGLASPWVAMLLLMIGGAGIVAELHAPGTAIGGFIALVAFSLFFWSQFLGGNAIWLEVILFMIGLGCLALEIFVIPGFGIFGLGGGGLIIVSVILACQRFILPRNTYQLEQLQNSLFVFIGASAGVIIAAVFIHRWLPKVPFVGGIMLAPPSEEEQDQIGQKESLVDYQWLVGKEGTTTTRLVPSGKARFEGHRIVDVISDGEMLAAGTRVVVVEVHGYRVLVEPVEQA
ncbi:MAG: NfeD family protein [Planctomycetia bacterium]|jgi:membrane-bound ClpP family serine protease